MKIAGSAVLAGALLAATIAAAAVPGVPLEASGPAGALKGTLTLATPDAPLVLILPGSGPTDRDGNSPLGIAAAPYRLLAEGLAARGIATLRIDKRGMFASSAAIADPNAVTIADYVADTRAWIAAARAKTGARCIWLAGHSEGGIIALAAADVADVCGIVLIATPGRPMGEVLRTQLKANPANAPILPQALAAIDRLEKGKRVDTAAMHPALMPLFRAQVQGFLISAFAENPARRIAAVTKPVLILQGTRDLQVGVEDARKLAAANPRARLTLLPDTNHVLKHVESAEAAANFATYADPALPLAPGAISAIADFIEANPGA